MNVPRGRRFTFGVLAVLSAVLGIAYSNSLGIGFYFDDTYGILNNPAIRTLRNVPRYFADPFLLTTFRDNVDTRPILVTSYAVNYAISGNQPWSYHLLNILLHLLASLFVFLIVRDLLWWPETEREPGGRARWGAAAAALFFALAPLNSEALDYMWARSALLCAVFYLAAFLALNKRRWVWGAVLFALALLTKAIAVTLPATVLLYDFLYRDRDRFPDVRAYLGQWKRLLKPVGIPAVLDVAYLVYRWAILPPWAANTRHPSWVTPGIWFMSQWSAVLQYVGLFIWPRGLSVDHDVPFTTALFSARALAPLCVLLIWAGLAYAARRRWPPVAFATGWFFLTLSPESSFFALSEVINEHRSYLPASLGLAFLLAWGLDRAAARLPAGRRLVFAGAALGLCAAAIPVVRHRNWQWQDGLRLWESTVATSPNNGRAWLNAGLGYMSRGDLARARAYFERALELTPNYSYLHMNLSVLDAAEGRVADSLREAQTAVRDDPSQALAYFYLGQALARSNRQDEARAAYSRALVIDPSNAEAKRALASPGSSREASDPEAGFMTTGLYLMQDRHPADAIPYFRQILQRNPNHYGATYQLARALDETGRPEEARPLWQRVLAMATRFNDAATATTARERLEPDAAVREQSLMKDGLADLYEKRDFPAAIARFRKILELNPTHYGATYQLAVALDAAGRRSEALPLWEKVLRMAQESRDTATAATAKSRLAAGS